MPKKNHLLHRTVPPGWIPAPALAWKIALTYAGFSALWILLSGHALHVLVTDDDTLEMLEILKGWFFILLTTVLLGSALQGYFSRIRSASSQVREAEEFASAVVNSLPAHIVVVNAQGAIVAVNDAWRRFGAENGLTQENSGLGANYLNVCAASGGSDAAVAAAVAEGIRDVFSGKRSGFEMEYACHSPTLKRWFKVFVTPVLDGSEPLAIIAHENITQRRLQEEAIRESEERFRHTFEQVALGITHVGLDNRWLRVNQRFCDIIGHTREEILQKSWKDFTHPSDLEADIDFMRQLEEGTIADYEFEKRYRRRNGTWIWVRLTVSLVRATDSSPAYFVTVVEDIHSRREMEAALQMQHAALDDALNGFDIVDEDGRFVYVNRACLRMWGYERPEALIGMSPVGLFHDPAALLESTTALLKTGKDVREFTARRRDGSTFDAMMAAKRFTSPDGRVLFIRSSLDVTERKRAEDAMRHRLALQEQLGNVAATVPGAVYSFRLRPDGSYCIPFASPVVETIFGVTPAEVQDNAEMVFERINPDDLNRINADIAQSARTLLPWKSEFRVRHPERGEIWVEGSSLPRRESDGSVLWHGFVHDITERKRIADALAESEQRYRLLADNTDDFITLNDTQGNRLYVSPSYYRVTGWTAEDVRDRHWTTRVHPDDFALIERTRAANLAGETTSIEHRVLCRNGSCLWVEARCKPVRDAAGHVAQMVVWSREITERKRAEDARRENEERLRTLGDNIPGGAVYQLVWAPDGRRFFPYMSGSIEKIFGITAARVMSEPEAFWQTIVEEDRPSLQVAEDASARNLTLFEREFRQWTLDGEIKWVHARSSPRRLQDGTIVWDGVVTDITERKLAEMARTESEERLRLALQGAGGGAWDWDLRTGEAWWSGEMYQLWGVEPGTPMRFENSMSVVHEADRAMLRTAVEEAIARGDIYHQEFRIRHALTGERWISSYGQLVRNHAGEVIRLLGISIDVTERRWAELKIHEQLAELRRWQDIILGREDRVQELKREVNELCRAAGGEIRYRSQEPEPPHSNSTRSQV